MAVRSVNIQINDIATPPPTISKEGNWLLYDGDKWVDTGIRAVGKDADPKLIEEIQTGLSDATKVIDTLDKAQQALKNGLLDKADIKGIQYLLDSLQNGSTTPAGGLLLTNDIILSDPNTKDVTAMISGTQTEGAKVIRLGIAKDGSEVTALNNNGTGHIGELHFNGDYIEIGKMYQRYVQIGGEALTEEEMTKASTILYTRSIYNAYTQKGGVAFIDATTMGGEGANVTVKANLHAIAIAQSERTSSQSGHTPTNPTTPGGPAQNLDYYESASATTTTYLRVQVGRAGELVKSFESERISVSARATGGTIVAVDKGIATKYDKREAEKDVLITVPAKDYRINDIVQVDLVTECRASNDRCENVAYTEQATMTSLYDQSKPEVRITKHKTSFFYGSRRYMLLNYDNLIAKIVGDVLMQGNLAIKGAITADSYQGNGMPLAGATFDSGGGEVRALGRYKNRSGWSTASAYYDYNYKTYTVYHSIPHDRYIPLVTPFGVTGNNGFWNLSVRVYEVKAYSFTMALLTNGDNPTQNGFSYVAFQAE